MRLATFHITYLGYTETFIHAQLVRQRGLHRRTLALSLRHPERFPLEGLRVRPRLSIGPRTLECPLAPWLSWQLRRHRPDVIHAHFGTAGRRILPYARWFGIPLVVSYYGFDVGILLEPERHPAHQWYTKSIHSLFRGAALHLVLTEEMRGRLIALGAPADRVRVHHNGVDLGRFRVAERPQRAGLAVLLCGREVEKKGFEYGLRALALARATRPDISVEFLGADGPLRPRLEALVRELALGDGVRFISDAEGLPTIMARQDVMMVPSVTARDGDREGLPTVLVEAAACGVPAVASRHAGIPEIVKHEQTGLLCEERDVKALSEALLGLATHRDLRARLGANARRLVEQEFDIERLVERLEGYYREVAKRRD